MNNGRTTSLFSIIIVLGAVACGADPVGKETSGEPPLGKANQASTQQNCGQVYTQTGQNCYAVGSCSWEPDCIPDINCDPEYGYVTYCYTAEVPTTPVLVYRSYNPTTHSHQYRTDTSVANGYASEGSSFALANDTYAGAVAFAHLDSGAGYYFPVSAPNAIPNLVPLYEFWNPAQSDALYTLDPSGGKAFPCNVYGQNGPPTVDCYEAVGVVGYVGRPPGLLLQGESLTTNQEMSSYDNRFHLVMQGDGNLVLYQGLPGQSMTALWSTGTWGTSGNTAVMQTDGNFVLYDSTNGALWSSGTWNNSGAYLAVQNDGNVVVYKNSTPLWASNTCCH